MKISMKILIGSILLLLVSLACRAQINPGVLEAPAALTAEVPSVPPTPVFVQPVQPGGGNPEEPTTIIGDIPFTSRFFAAMSEPFVMLEDQAGFFHRDHEYPFSLAGQDLGPIEPKDEQTLTYELALPSVPQGTMLDVDNDGSTDAGVQVFAVALWDNTWGDPFLEKRDGTGWSNAYASTITDPNRDYEIQGGTLVVWAPDGDQSFPTGFGEDNKLFTADDPTAPIPAGYNLVNLNQEPFQFTKQARPQIDLIEGVSAVSDFSEMSYGDAFEALFKKVSVEYPFTTEKGIDWPGLHSRFQPQFSKANDQETFYKLLRDFAKSIPDGHIGVGGNDDLFLQLLFQQFGGGFGLVVEQTSDGQIIATQVLPDLPAAKAGIHPGAEIISWDGVPVNEAIQKVDPFLAPYSTDQNYHLAQVRFLTRNELGKDVQVGYKNPGEDTVQEAEMTSEPEYQTLSYALEFGDPALQPIDAQVLTPSGLGYIRIRDFSDDYHLTAKLWDRYIKYFQDNGIKGIILDMRENGGGNGALASDFAGYFFDQEKDIAKRSYYNTLTGKFEYSENIDKVEPAPSLFDGPVAVLVGPACMSACEGFVYTLQQDGRATIVGNYPSGGAYGEVGRGQYKLPDGLTMQFPTGRSENMDGKLIIEGVGVIPDIQVPITAESLLSPEDSVLQAAINALLDKLK